MEVERRRSPSTSKPAPRTNCAPGLIALGHQIEAVADSYMDFGAGQIILRTDGGYVAASDPRRDGQAAGF